MSIKCDKTKKVAGYGQLEYTSKKLFQKIYPTEQGGFKVVGAIGKGLTKQIDEILVGNKYTPYYEIDYKKYVYDIDGYVEIGEHEFLAVVQSVGRKHLLKIILLLLILLGGILAGNYVLQNRGPNLELGAEKFAPNVKIPEDFEEGRIAIPGYKDFKLAAGGDTLYVALWNPEENPCYFQFSMVLDSTGEELYKSKLISPGLAVKAVPLNRRFEEGVYPVTVRIKTYDLNNYKEEMNGGQISTRIIAISEGSSQP